MRAHSGGGPTEQARYYAGIPMMSYDLVKELVLAVVVIGLIVLGAAFAMSSPDEQPVTIQSWAQTDPVDFVTTATAELAGTSESATYGGPYTDGTDGVQWIGPFSPQAFFGNAMHLDTAHQFVLDPLTIVAGDSGELHDALATYSAATADQQAAWTSAYSDALADATVSGGTVSVAPGDYGPVPVLMSHELAVARSGNLDGLVLGNSRFYQTNYSAPLLFMADGEYLSGLAEDQHLSGDQWGMMNETGSYPGQVWLLPVSFWYQISPFDTAANADLLIMLIVGVLLLVLVFVPFIPILRDIPRWIPIHRLIWRRSALADPGPQRK